MLSFLAQTLIGRWLRRRRPPRALAPDALEQKALRKAMKRSAELEAVREREGWHGDEAKNIAIYLKRHGFYTDVPVAALRRHVAAALVRSRAVRPSGGRPWQLDPAKNVHLFLQRSVSEFRSRSH